MKRNLALENGLALLAALTFLAIVSSATTAAVEHNYSTVEFNVSAPSN